MPQIFIWGFLFSWHFAPYFGFPSFYFPVVVFFLFHFVFHLHLFFCSLIFSSSLSIVSIVLYTYSMSSPYFIMVASIAFKGLILPFFVVFPSFFWFFSSFYRRKWPILMHQRLLLLCFVETSANQKYYGLWMVYQYP